MYFVRRERNRLRILYDDYPRQFWVLVLGTFVDGWAGRCCGLSLRSTSRASLAWA